MILQVSEDVTRIGLRIKSWRNQRYVDNWEDIHLVITPGQRHEHCCCHGGGSPWFVWGCWPLHRTGVDLSNPEPPDFPAFVLDAAGKSDDMITFTLPNLWHEIVPFGRYNGSVRYQPSSPVPIIPLPPVPTTSEKDWSFLDPGCYHTPPGCDCPQRESPHGSYPQKPPRRLCILAEFDIDYGPRCSQHIIDKAAIDV